MIKVVTTLRLTGFCVQETIKRHSVKPDKFQSSSNHTILGFTLIELLLAIFILSIMLTTVFGGLNHLFGNIPSVTQKGALYEMGSRFMKRISLDLRGIHVTANEIYEPPDLNGSSDPYLILGGNRYDGTYGTNFLRFSSSEHVALDNTPDLGISEIVYYLHEIRKGEFVLRRSDRLYRKAHHRMNKNDPVVCKAVEALRFTFYDRNGKEYDHWDSDSEAFDYAIPAAVGIFLKLHGKAGSHSFQTTVALSVTRGAWNKDA